MTEAWDMRSNIKAKPGSQGTLFGHDKSVLNPRMRWPKGYEPERLSEVREALDHGTEVHGSSDTHQMAHYARIVDTVARSTIPAEHLKGLRTVDHRVNPGTEGTYWPGRRHL